MMPLSALTKPTTDPTLIFEHFRNGYGTELLTVACTDFDIFGKLAKGPKTFTELSGETGLANRAANVLFTALRSMKLIEIDSVGKYTLTPEAREHLVPEEYFEVGGYVGLVAEAPQVRAMAERLKTNKPAENRKEDTGAAFIFRPGLESAMDQSDSARRLTMALAGRAKNVAPYLAEAVDLSGAKTLLDIGGGTGIYAIAFLQKNPHLKAIVWDRAEVLKVAGEMAVSYGVANRLELVPGDMFTDPVPSADVMLLSNILHDWDEPECLRLLKRCADDLLDGGRLLVHDVFLDDDLGGPFPIAMYSAALFTLTEGRAYAAEEYRKWLMTVGLKPTAKITPTMVHCGVLEAVR
ncbi:methyltransferase [Zavarzinella formosa]|uniref:methyltransferase n=1 Tax=Zavarzinella formosa TaxID=360055 RepID=UPI001930A950|nr:methyltransferase [Zavarzinella formosa]